MANSGRIPLTVTSKGGAIKGWIDWAESAVDTAANTSRVTARLIYRNDDSTWDTLSDSSTFTLTVNGVTVSNTDGGMVPHGGGTLTALEQTVTVSHDPDGAKSITISGGGALQGTQGLQASSGSGTAALTAIPRATAPRLPESGEMGSVVTIQLPRASVDFTHNLWYKLTGSGGGYSLITRGAGTSWSWTVPMELCDRLPTAESASVTVVCQTYRGSTQIGSDQTAVMTVRVPSALRPEASLSVEIVNDDAVVDAWRVDGAPVALKGYTRLRYTVTGDVSLDYGAALSGWEFTGNGRTRTGEMGQTGLTDPLAAAGEVTVRGRVQDSRGRWSEPVSRTVSVYDYAVPAVTDSHAYRCAANGAAARDGTCLHVLCGASVSPVGGCNSASCRVRWRESGGTWGGYTDLVNGTARVLAASLDPARSYQVELSVTDALGASRTVSFTVPTAEVTFHLRAGGRGAAFGKYAETDGVLESAWPVRVDGGVSCAGLTLDGAAVGDFVTEQGVTGVWTWRKWHSGAAECWMRDTRELTHYTTVGNLYGYVSDPYDYPVSFTEVPTVVASARVGNGFALCSGDFRQQTDHFTFYILSTASGTQTCTLSCCVRGRWK